MDTENSMDTENLDRWVIFSREHGMWWGPGACGYVPNIADAGRFLKESAEFYTNSANALLSEDAPREEIFYPAPEVYRAMARMLKEQETTIHDLQTEVNEEIHMRTGR